MKDINGIEIKQGQDIRIDCLYSGGYLYGRTAVIKMDNKLYCKGIHGIMPIEHYVNEFQSIITVIR